MKYYFTSAKDSRGLNQVICERDGMPVDIIETIELPNNNGYFEFNGKQYPDFKIVQAIRAGQITVDQVTAIK